MRKGVTAKRMIWRMKWAAYYGMGKSCNLLLGFPGETQADYDQQLLPCSNSLSHLPPPSGGVSHFAATVQSELYPGDGDGLRECAPGKGLNGYIYPGSTSTRDA